MIGIITKIISQQYQVTVKKRNYKCIVRGKVRLQTRPLVGDKVVFEAFDSVFGIEEILPRSNELIRPAIANVDQVLIVMSAVDPEFSTTLIDRLSFMVNYENLTAHLLITKLDKINKDHPVYDYIKEYQSSGFVVIDAFDLESLKNVLADKITVLAGQSGVGKSTSINRLNPKFNLVTQETSRALNRGKHTTRFTCLYPIGSGWIADTPGFSAMNWLDKDIKIFADCPADWLEYIGKCKYRNCIHEFEPSCQIKEAVKLGKLSSSRYEHYLECLQLIRNG